MITDQDMRMIEAHMRKHVWVGSSADDILYDSDVGIMLRKEFRECPYRHVRVLYGLTKATQAYPTGMYEVAIGDKNVKGTYIERKFRVSGIEGLIDLLELLSAYALCVYERGNEYIPSCAEVVKEANA